MSLLAPLKKSAEYRAIRPRVANPRAIDSWQDQGVHFFVFQVNPAEGPANVLFDAPVVVFAMHPAESAPVSAVLVTPKPGGEDAEVMDLRQPSSAYTAAFDQAGAQAHTSEPDPENRSGVIAKHTANTEAANGHISDANFELLRAIKASPEFQGIESRLAQSLPAESWQEDDAHFFAFQLLPADGSSPNGREPPIAVFAMRPPDRVPISAVVVSPQGSGENADVIDLRQLDSSYSVPLSG